MAKQTLKQALNILLAGRSVALRRAASALDGCPFGGWGETVQARRQILEDLPAREARSYTVDDWIDSVYVLDGAERYRTKRAAVDTDWSRQHPEQRAHGAWDRRSRG